MRFRKSMTVSVCVVGAGLLAAGCSPSSSSSTAGSAATPAATTAATPAATPAATQSAATTTACTANVLSFAFGAKTGTATQPTQAVDMTNKGSSACTMRGFPGVDLVGAANGKQSYSWPLRRSSASYSPVTLQPGGSAHFNLVYLPKAAGDSTDIAVSKIVMTPPNTFSQAQLTWNQSVLLQDGATHPGTYIGPVTVGA
ncbi:MAG: DUF4232 domain-containing protein [Trebonia sp.]